MNYTRYLSLNAQVVYAKLDPRYCGLLDQTCKHDGAWHLYFQSYELLPPSECIPDDVTITCKPIGDDWFHQAPSSASGKISLMKTHLGNITRFERLGIEDGLSQVTITAIGVKAGD